MASITPDIPRELFQLQDTNIVGEMISYIPQLIGAVVVLLVGWIVGRLFGGLVTTVLTKVGLDRFAQGTALGTEKERGEGGVRLARGLGKLVKYYVYYLAILTAANILSIPVLTKLLSDIGGYIPVIFGAAIILVVGFIVGRVLEDITADLIGGFGFDAHFEDTPLERFSPQRGIGGIVGQLVALYVYFLALLAAADTLNIGVLSQLLTTITVYIPKLIGGVAVLLIGLWFGDWLGEVVANTDRSRLTNYVGIGVKVFVYYLVLTMALQTAGFDASILSTLFVIAMSALFGAIAIAFIIAVGVGGALGSKEYISNNISGWMDRAHQSVSVEGDDVAGSESTDS